MSRARPRICVAGSANIDLTFHTPRFPRPGETVAGTAFHRGFGGKGANQAVMAARLGAEVTMIGKVGRDAFGADVIANLKAEGIATTHLQGDETCATGVASILVDAAANNCILVVPGANAALTPADVRTAACAIEAADVLLGQLETPVNATLEAFRIARTAGVRTVLNPAPAVASLPGELLRLTDLFVPNETEAELFTGTRVGSPAEAEAVGRRLLALPDRPGAVIVTLGSRGAVLVDGAGAQHVRPVPVQAVDTSGAGDALIGSLAVFWAQGRPLPDALRLAGAAAALSVTRPGTQASFPRWAELEPFLTALPD